MSFWFYFFHDCSLISRCLDQKCSEEHVVDFKVKETNALKVLSSIPLLAGQLVGAFYIYFGFASLTANDRQYNAACYSLIVRGILCFLGLGILCLLLDIIMTAAILIKQCCC